MGLIDTISAFDAAFAIDADLCPGVESVTIKQTGADPRSINVQVFRKAPENVSGITAQLVPDITAFIARHATKGATSINVNGDVLSLPLNYGGAAIDQLITQVIKEDAGGFLVKLG